MKKKLSGLLLLFVILFGFLIPNVSHAQVPADIIGGPTTVANGVKAPVEKTVQSTWQKIVSTIFNVTVSKALDKIAYDTASYIGSGGEGQKPLFVTKGFGAYMKDIGDNAVGDAMEQFAKGTGLNICSPDLNFKLKIGLGLSNMTLQTRPSDSQCKLSNAIQNWKNDINAKWAEFQSPDFLKDLSGSFSLTAPSGVNASLGILTQAEDAVAKTTTNAANQQVKDQGYTEKTDVAGNVTAPPGTAKNAIDNTQNSVNNNVKVQPTQNLLVDAAKVFVNQLAATAFNHALQNLAKGNIGGMIPWAQQIDNGKLVGSEDWWHKQIMAVTTCDRTPLDGCNANGQNDQDQSKCYDGYTCNSDCKCVSSDPAATQTQCNPLTDPNCTNTGGGGVAAITQQLQSFAQPKYDVKADLDVLTSLGSCPDPQNIGPTDCVMDDKLMQAVQEKKTVVDAVSEGSLDPTWKMTADDNKTYQDAYTLRDVKILSQYRILPVGWQELITTAAANNNANISLGDAMACFDPNDQYANFSPNFVSDGKGDTWCQGLVDPNWVLKAPATQCAKLGVGNQILSKDIINTVGSDGKTPETQVLLTRNENYCADVQSCIKEKADGTCEKFGYCTQEKRTWNFSGSQSCDPVFNTCHTYQATDGTQASYLENTIDYSACNSGLAGCKAYATTGVYNSSTNIINWDAHNLKYFTSAVGTCDASNEGCSGLIRTDNYHNFLVNGDFEDNSNLSDWLSGKISTTTTGYASAQGLLIPDGSSLNRTVNVGPADYDISDEAYTLSFYSNCNATTTIALGAKSIKFNPETDWAYHYITNVYPHDEGSNQVTFSIAPQAGGSCSIDKIKLEKGLDSSAYSEYGSNDTIYEKLMPQYLESLCYVNTGSNKNYDLSPFAPAVCQKFAKKCNADEVGCKQYTAVGDTLPVQAVAKAADYCTGECVGYDTYVQKETAFNVASSANFIPKTATACSAAAVGCNEFTNLDSLSNGGESKEYYSYLRECVKPSDSNYTCTEFTDLEDTTQGQNLKTYILAQSKIAGDNGPMTYGTTSYAFSGNKTSECNVQNFNLPPTDPNYNPDCHKLQDKAGGIHYVNLGQTITCNDNCLRYRVSDNITSDKCDAIGGKLDGTTATSSCIIQAVPGQGQACTAAENGCRQYDGNQGNNVKIAAAYDFENGVNPIFDQSNSTNSITPEANVADGHSLVITNTSPNNPISAWNSLKPVSLGNKIIIFVKNVLHKLSLDALAGSTVPTSGVAINVSDKVVRNSSYTIKFLAKASASAAVSFDLSNGKDDAQFVSSEQEGGSVYITGDNTWRLYQVYLPNLDHDISNNEGLIISTGNANPVYVDNIVLTQITDRYYLIKDSWKTPDSCYYDIFANYQGTNYNLGCQAYTDVDNNTHYLRNFSKICGASSVGCEAMINTGNSSAVTSTPNYIYAVYDPAKLCGADNKGCSRLGQSLLSNQDVSIQNVYSDVYVKDNPDTYTTTSTPGTTCSSDAVGCTQFTSSDGSVNYFKDPGGSTCEWRTATGDTVKKWYRSATMRCDMNNDNKISVNNGVVTEQYNRLCLRDSDCAVGGLQGKCIVDTNDYLCPVEMSKTLGFGGTAIYQPSGATGICDSGADTCSELIDPKSDFMPNLVLDPNGMNGAYASDQWSTTTPSVQGLNPLLTPNKLYSFSATVGTSSAELNCSTTVRVLNSDNSLGSPVNKVVITSASANNSVLFYTAISDSNVKAVKCAVAVNGWNPSVSVDVKEAAIDYQLDKNLDKTSCNGVPNSNSGCVLFNERSVAASSTLPFGQKLADLGYISAQSYNYAKLYSACGAYGQPACDSNALIKATPDRTCAKWLACDDYALDGTTQVCSHYAECTAADDSGQCNTFLQTATNASHTFSSSNDQNSSGFSLLNNFYFKDMKQVGGSLGNYDFENLNDCSGKSNFCKNMSNAPIPLISSPGDSNLKPNVDYPAHGKNFIRVGGLGTEESAATFDVAASSTQYINFLVNGDALAGRGFHMSINGDKTITGCGSNLNCFVSDGSTPGMPLIYRNGGTALMRNGKYSIIDGSGWQRMVAKISVPKGVTNIQIVFYTSESGYYAFMDDINIEPVLQVADNTLIAKDCRLYPKTDSLTCESDNKSVVANGLYGYCLQYDSKNPSVCLMWYPVGGDGSSIDNYSATNMFTGFTSSGLTPSWCTNVTVNAAPVEHREMKVLSYLGYCSADSDSNPSEASSCWQYYNPFPSTERDYFGRTMVAPASIFPESSLTVSDPAYNYYVASYEEPGTYHIWQALIQVPKNNNLYTFFDSISNWSKDISNGACSKGTNDKCLPTGAALTGGGWWAEGSSYTQTGSSSYKIISADNTTYKSNCITLNFVGAGNCGGSKSCPDGIGSHPTDGYLKPSNIQLCVDAPVNGWYDYNGFAGAGTFHTPGGDWGDFASSTSNNDIFFDQGEHNADNNTSYPSVWDSGNTKIWNKASDEPLTCTAYTTPPTTGGLVGDPLITWVARAKAYSKSSAVSTGWDLSGGVTPAIAAIYASDPSNQPFSAVSSDKGACDLTSGACGLPYGCMGNGCAYLSAANGKLTLNTTAQTNQIFSSDNGGATRFDAITKNLFLYANSNTSISNSHTEDGPSPIPHDLCTNHSSIWCAILPSIADTPTLCDKKNNCGGAITPGYYTLNFGVNIDPEQLPLKYLRIEWGDGKAATEKFVIDPRSGSEQFRFVHYYEATPSLTYEHYPKISVTDNWGFYKERFVRQ